MSFLGNKINGIRKRWRDLAFGIVYLRSSDFRIPGSLWIGGRFRKVRFSGKQTDQFKYEFSEICVSDCYHLDILKKRLGKVTSIIDVGANQGLFLVAARKRFPRSAIHCYEPNAKIKPFLHFNVQSLGASCFFEAVTKEDCKVRLNFFDSDLHTTAEASSEGDVTGTSFRNVLQRAGQVIDILKLDCEGAEWALLEDEEPWKQVQSITMEYHLWAKAGSSAEQLIARLDQLGFTLVEHAPLSNDFGLLTAIKKGR